MHLFISKRFEFSSSHRLAAAGWTDEQNVAFYGREGTSRHGHGHNYVAYFSFEGVIDQATGMIINVVIIKDKIKALRKYREECYEQLKSAVYKRRGWTEDGVPTIEKIKELGIDYPEVIELLK